MSREVNLEPPASGPHPFGRPEGQALDKAPELRHLLPRRAGAHDFLGRAAEEDADDLQRIVSVAIEADADRGRRSQVEEFRLQRIEHPSYSRGESESLQIEW